MYTSISQLQGVMIRFVGSKLDLFYPSFVGVWPSVFLALRTLPGALEVNRTCYCTGLYYNSNHQPNYLFIAN